MSTHVMAVEKVNYTCCITYYYCLKVQPFCSVGLATGSKGKPVSVCLYRQRERERVAVALL